MELRSHALQLASLGFSIIPLHTPAPGGQCSCGDHNCRSPGKHPRTRRGVKDASRDTKQIEQWWKQYPDANIGVATGGGIRVLDVDPRNGGDSSLAQLEATHGALPPTLSVNTGGGGKHLYFRVPEGSANSCGIAGKGLDVKGNGGYVVAPPSLHVSGALYAWRDAPNKLEIASLPGWLAEPSDFSGRAGRAPSDASENSVWVQIPGEIERLIKNGKPVGKRSEAVHRVLRSLLSAGADDPTIIALMMDAAYGISDKPRQRGAKWLKGEITRARSKLNVGFELNAKGAIVANSQHNIDEALRRLGVQLRYDMFANQYLIDSSENSGRLLEDAELDGLWLAIDAKFHFRPGEKFFAIVVKDRARKNAFHPVRDYLNGLKWDGTPRLDGWLAAYAGAKDTPYTRAVGALSLIAAVRRGRKPGTKFDEMLTLCSGEGKDKSTALEVLAVKEDWFCDDVSLNARSKEMIEQVQGVWIVECADLKGIRKSEIGAVKSLLSRRRDKARLAYDRLPSTVSRSCVFFGTTNDPAFLRSTTGNRRFWPVEIEAFDLVALRHDRDQLWAEAAAREATGESIRLDPQLYEAAREEQEAKRVEDPFLHTLQMELADKVGKVRAADIWEILSIAPGQRTQDHNDRVGAAMKELGWQRMKLRFGGKTPEWAYARGTKEEREIHLPYAREGGQLYDGYDAHMKRGRG